MHGSIIQASHGVRRLGVGHALWNVRRSWTWAALTELASYCSSLDSGNAIVVVVAAAVSAGLV